MTRPSWDNYWLNQLSQLSGRATCNRGKSSCIIVKDNIPLMSGYVGAPSKFPHCDEAGHLIHKVIDDAGKQSEHCIRTLHAEQNAIILAAKKGISLDGGTIYVTMTPCRVCAMMIIGVGVKRVVALNDYHSGALSKEFFKKARVKFEIMNKEIKKY